MGAAGYSFCSFLAEELNSSSVLSLVHTLSSSLASRDLQGSSSLASRGIRGSMEA